MDNNPYSSPKVASPIAPGSQGSNPYQPCPNCGGADSAKVSFTWWGGVLGPALFTHVKCPHCNTAYNGKTGQSNTTKIVVYTVVVFAIAAVVGVLVVMNQ